MRLLVALAAIVVLAGCGTVAGRSGAPGGDVQVADAPPIVAVDEAPPDELQGLLDMEFAPPQADSGAGGSIQVVLSPIGSTGQTSAPVTAPTPAQLAAFRAELAARRDRIRPAAGSPPRVVARLPLAEGGSALFVAWRNGNGDLCTYSEVDAPSGGGGNGPTCLGSDPGVHCAALCLSSDGWGTKMVDHWVLSGTVAAAAEALDVTTANGTTEYPLTGPLLPGGDRRVFMLELGTTDWRKLALVQGGTVIDETSMPALSVASEECSAKLGPMPAPSAPEAGAFTPSADMQAWNSSFSACLQASGALPTLPVLPEHLLPSP